MSNQNLTELMVEVLNYQVPRLSRKVIEAHRRKWTEERDIFLERLSAVVLLRNRLQKQLTGGKP